jgi:Ribbon-Helix-Helix transcriptional regulator family
LRRPVKQSTARKGLDLDLRNYGREDLEAAQRAGEMLHINVLGLASIACRQDEVKTMLNQDTIREATRLTLKADRPMAKRNDMIFSIGPFLIPLTSIAP